MSLGPAVGFSLFPANIGGGNGVGTGQFGVVEDIRGCMYFRIPINKCVRGAGLCNCRGSSWLVVVSSGYLSRIRHWSCLEDCGLGVGLGVLGSGMRVL